MFFMVLLASLGWRVAGSSSAIFSFWLFSVGLFLPMAFSGFHRPSRGCSAFFGCWSFAAALVFSLFPPAEGRLAHRLGVVIAFLWCPSSSIKSAQTSILFAYLQIFS